MKKTFAPWHKAVLIGCLVIAILGTIGMLGGMVKVTGTINEYGGSVGVPVYMALMMGLFSLWLFAGSGALLVYIAKTNNDITTILKENGKG